MGEKATKKIHIKGVDPEVGKGGGAQTAMRIVEAQNPSLGNSYCTLVAANPHLSIMSCCYFFIF